MQLKEHSSVLTLALIIVANILIIAALQITATPEEPNLRLDELRIEFSNRDIYTVDHSNFEELNREFATPQQVTEACLSCDEGRHEESIKSYDFK